MERAVGVFRTAASKVGDFHAAVSLLLNGFEHIWNGDAFVFHRDASAEITYGLEMYATNVGLVLFAEFKYSADLVVVYAGGDNRD